MNIDQFRYWLCRNPRPTSLRLIDANAGEQVLSCKPIPPAKNTSWQAISASVCAMDPTLIHALDENGDLLRAVRSIDILNDARTDEEEVAAPADPDSEKLIIFAKLIAEAYRHSTEVAFDKLGALFDAVVARSNSQEKTISALDRMVQKLMLEKVADGAGLGGDDGGGPLTLDTLLQGMMQGKLQAEAGRVATNGAPEKTKESGKK